MSTENPTNPKDFAKRVSALRRRLGLKQGPFAKKLWISRSYLSEVENGLQPSEKVIERVAELERGLDVGKSTAEKTADQPATPRIREGDPHYELIKKVIYIEEFGTPDQLKLLDSFLESVCEQLGLPRGATPSDAVSGSELEKKEDDLRGPGHAPPKKIGFHGKKGIALLRQAIANAK